MLNKRHFIFNIILLTLPWLTVLLLGKRNFKRFAFSSLCIVIVEMISHVIGKKRNWWRFYSKSKSFLLNELPFTLGPYMPLSIWMLTLSYGNFKRFISLNAVIDAIFSFIIMKWLSKMKIISLHKLNSIQFFFYIYSKAYLLYFIQYIVENRSNWFARLTNKAGSHS